MMLQLQLQLVFNGGGCPTDDPWVLFEREGVMAGFGGLCQCIFQQQKHNHSIANVLATISNMKNFHTTIQLPSLSQES